MILRKKYETGFSIVPNFVITDDRLTNTEKVVLFYLCGRPENWIVNNSDIMRVAGIKTRHKMAEVWKRLTQFSFINRVERKVAGRFSGYDIELFPGAEPCVDKQHTVPCVDKTHTVSTPLGVNNTLIKKDSFKKKEEEKKEEDHHFVSNGIDLKQMASEMRDVLRKKFGKAFVDMCPDGSTVDETMIKFAEYWHYQKDRPWDKKNEALKKAICASFEQWNPIYEGKESVKAEMASELNSGLFSSITGHVEKLIYDMQPITAEQLVEFKKFLDGDGSRFSIEDWIEHVRDLRDGSGRTYNDLIRIAKTRLKYMM